MKRVIAALVAAALAAACTSGPDAGSGQTGKGEIRQFKVSSSLLGITAASTVSVYLPGSYDTSSRSYPVLYLLPGSDGTHLTFLGSGYGQELWMSEANAALIVDRLLEEGRIKPLVLVCPDLEKVDQDFLVRDLVPFVDRTFRTARGRGSRAIAGHSTGGFDALSAAVAHPELFAAACSFSAAGLEVLIFRLDEAARSLSKPALQVQFWVYAGANDQYGLAPENKDFVDALRKHGLPVQYFEDEGDHIDRVPQRLEEAILYCSALFR